MAGRREGAVPLDPRRVRAFGPLAGFALQLLGAILPLASLVGDGAWSFWQVFEMEERTWTAAPALAFLGVIVAVLPLFAALRQTGSQDPYRESDHRVRLGRDGVRTSSLHKIAAGLVLGLLTASVASVFLVGVPCGPARCFAAAPGIGWFVAIVGAAVVLLTARVRINRPWMLALLGKAKDRRASRRSAAARALEDGLNEGHTEDLPAIADCLVGLSKDPEGIVRDAAAWGLAALARVLTGERLGRVAEAVEGLSNDPDDDVRDTAAMAMGTMSTLRETLSPMWRSRLIVRLRTLGEQELQEWSPETFPTALHELQALDEEEIPPAHREGVAELLRRLKDLEELASRPRKRAAKRP